MAEHDVIKTRFPLKLLNVFFWNFDERCQVDAREGAKSFASIFGAVFELSRKPSRRGQNLNTLPARRGLIDAKSILWVSCWYAYDFVLTYDGNSGWEVANVYLPEQRWNFTISIPGFSLQLQYNCWYRDEALNNLTSTNSKFYSE